MLVVAEQVAILLVFALAGYALAKGKIADPGHGKILSVLVLYVFAPCFFMNAFIGQCTIAYLSTRWPMILVCLGLVVILNPLGYFLGKLLSKDHYERLLLAYCFITTNYGYFGYPLVKNAFGPEVLLDMMIFAMPLSIWVQAVAFPMLTSRDHVSPKNFLNPSILSIVAGIILGISGLKVPEFITGLLSSAGSCIGPCSMLLMGISLSEYKLGDVLKNPKIYIASVLRLIVIPAVIVLVSSFFLPKQWLLIEAMVFAMPCGMNTVVYPKLIGRDAHLGAGLTIVSSVSTLITLPLWVHFLGG
jgi:predicted permease